MRSLDNSDIYFGASGPTNGNSQSILTLSGRPASQTNPILSRKPRKRRKKQPGVFFAGGDRRKKQRAAFHNACGAGQGTNELFPSRRSLEPAASSTFRRGVPPT